MCVQEKLQEKHKQELQALKVTNTVLTNSYSVLGEEMHVHRIILKIEKTGNRMGT